MSIFKKKIIFFVEGNFQIKYLFPLIEEFKKNLNFHIELLSLEKINSNQLGSVEIKIIKPHELIHKLSNLEADLFFSTTPGIGTAYFPKSKVLPKNKRPKYVYIFHSLVSPNEVYFKNSFKKFDIIISPNEIISQQLKYLISKYTKIFTLGYPLLTSTKLQITQSHSANNVLIAPSWGTENFLTNKEFVEKLIKHLNSKNYNIYLRPHKMTKINLSDDLLNLVNLDTSPEINYNAYDYLFTDWSGIALEFYYFKRQKIFFVNSPKKKRRKLSRKEREFKLIENEIRQKIGEIINYNDDLEEINYDQNKIVEDDYINNIFLPQFQVLELVDVLDEFYEK